MTEAEQFFLAERAAGSTLVLDCPGSDFPLILAGGYGLPVTAHIPDKELCLRVQSKAENLGVEGLVLISRAEPFSEIRREKFDTIIVFPPPEEDRPARDLGKFLNRAGRIFQRKEGSGSWEMFFEGQPQERISRLMLEPTVEIAPVITVGIAAYNRAWCLAEAVDSVLAQTEAGFELLVVDDGSTDGTRALLEKYPSEKLRCIRQSNQGYAAARNRLVEEARTEYLLCLDSDDILLPNTVKLYRKQLERFPAPAVVYADLWMFNENGVFRRKTYRNYQQTADYIPDLPEENPLPNPGSAISQKCFAAVGNYNPENYRDEDYEFWARLARHHFSLRYLDLPLLKYRVHRKTRRRETRQQLRKKAVSYRRTVDEIFRLPLDRLFPDLAGAEPAVLRRKLLLRKLELILRRRADISDFSALAGEILRDVPARRRLRISLVLRLVVFLKRRKILRRAVVRKILRSLETRLT